MCTAPTARKKYEESFNTEESTNNNNLYLKRVTPITIKVFSLVALSIRLEKNYLRCTRSEHVEVLGFPTGDAYYYRDIFARFKIMQRK